MNAVRLQKTQWALALSLTLTSLGAAAQTAATTNPNEAPAAKAAEGSSESPLDLGEIVVTGSAKGGSKMTTSVSVSTLDSVALEQTVSTSAAELLRSIPGIRSESSGGESNANLTVRGVPISAGGARYVQFQEDGLPVLQFGDIAFATPDSFVRADMMVKRLEVVRGGSASTLATNAPGGIINFITRKGEEAGGSIGLGYGVDFDQARYDARYGGPLGENTRFEIGGFYRAGEGARESGVNVEQGGQIRGNVTRDFDNGFVTLSFKHLDDQAPTLLPVPVRYSSNGKIQRIPGIDPRDATFYSPYLLQDNTLAANNDRVLSNINDGLTAKTDAFGVQAEFEFDGGWTVANNFRIAKNSGRFIGVFPGSDVADVSTTYATGPNAGDAYNGPAFTAVIFNTSLDDMSLTANDLKLSKAFDLADNGEVTAGVGLYTSMQTLDVTWNFNQYLLEAKGKKAAVLTSADNGSNAFGGCCSNTQQSQYDTTSPYAFVTWQRDAVTIDASVRRDQQDATGTYNQLLLAPAGSTEYDLDAARIIDYSVDHTSYSVGSNYRFTQDLAVFARYSDGVAFNADRITFFNAAGLVDGSSPVPTNTIKQTEAGVKWRSGALSTFVTFFKAKTDESNYDVTTQKASANTYDSQGVELEMGYAIGGFSLGGGLTYTDAEVTRSNNPALEGKAPKRQADVIYQLTPSYSFDKASLGLSIIGTTDSKDDGTAGPLTVTLPAYVVVNSFANYRPVDAVELSLGVNNLLDEIGYTESNDGRGAARSINGRTIRAGIRYSF